MEQNKKTSRTTLGTILGLVLLGGAWAADHFLGLNLLGSNTPATKPPPASSPDKPPAKPAKAPSRAPNDSPDPVAGGDHDKILDAFRRRSKDVPITAGGIVQRILPDDNEGSRHQKFIVRLHNDHTILIAHNIDLAPRVPVGQGDTVEFRGDYEWNERGGVVHWTHHDPRKRHREGWIKHRGKTYE